MPYPHPFSLIPPKAAEVMLDRDNPPVAQRRAHGANRELPALVPDAENRFRRGSEDPPRLKWIFEKQVEEKFKHVAPFHVKFWGAGAFYGPRSLVGRCRD